LVQLKTRYTEINVPIEHDTMSNIKDFVVHCYTLWEAFCGLGTCSLCDSSDAIWFSGGYLCRLTDLTTVWKLELVCLYQRHSDTTVTAGSWRRANLHSFLQPI